MQNAAARTCASLPLVTIDGADARDFDDAVYCEATSNGWRLLVAIADVSHYVKSDTALDREAFARGNSVYFPERVIPMLPEVLSNGLCSLNPEVDRLCMVCEMRFNREGRMTRSRFFEGLMRSHARLTYSEAAAIVVDQDEQTRKRYQPLVPHLESCTGFTGYCAASAKRARAIDFETTETRIVFGTERKIERIVPLVRNDAHKLIEECMIAANVAAARYLERHKMPTLYRIHARPAPDKVTDLQEFLNELGLGLRGGSKPTASDYSRVLKAGRRPAGCPPDQHRAAALHAARGIQPGQHRPLRPGARTLCALHLADPALSGPAGASRHPPHPGGQEAGLSLHGRRYAGIRRSLLGHGAPCRRRHPRRHRLAEVRIHAGQGR